MSRRQLDLGYNNLKLQKIVYGGWFRIAKINIRYTFFKIAVVKIVLNCCQFM